jgi:hypothetical protein
MACGVMGCREILVVCGRGQSRRSLLLAADARVVNGTTVTCRQSRAGCEMTIDVPPRQCSERRRRLDLRRPVAVAGTRRPVCWRERCRRYGAPTVRDPAVLTL